MNDSHRVTWTAFAILAMFIKLVFTFIEPVWSTVKNRPWIIPSSCYLPCLLLWHFDVIHFLTSCLFANRNCISVSFICFYMNLLWSLLLGQIGIVFSLIHSSWMIQNIFYDSFFIFCSRSNNAISCYLLSYFNYQLFILQFEIWSSIVSSAPFFLLLS